MRPIDADALMKKCGDWYVEEGTEFGFIGTLKNLLATEPTIHVATDINVGDRISRQAALDVLNEYFARIGKLKKRGLTKGEKAISLDTVGAIKTLPPAQPEPQWIPISDRLPRDGTWNIFTDGKNISVERYKTDAIDHFFPNGRWFQLEDVIAWMPLPTPYTK